MEKKTIKNLLEMEAFAKDFYTKNFPAPSQKKATILFLSGELGSGKTTFVRFLTRVLGVKARVTSPTFVIEKRYRIPSKGSPFRKLIHIDLYRLCGSDVFGALDFEETASDPENLICIEWPENLSEGVVLPDAVLRFEFVDENSRRVEVRGWKMEDGN